MHTRDETIDLSHFVLGDAYSRHEMMQLGGVTHHENIFTSPWGIGPVEFRNALLIFVTLDKGKAADAYKYADSFEGELFLWQSQNRQAQDDDLIVRMGTGQIPTHLFARVQGKDGKGKGTPFTYCGLLSVRAMDGNNPVDCVFDLVDYVEGATGSLAELYAWRPEQVPSATASQQRSQLLGKRGGQGRLQDTELRLAIEQYAMQHAKHHYAAAGYEVEDTSLTRPYDLVCRKGSAVRRVEVKGTTSSGDRVILTSGEVLAAREPGVVTDLYIVRSVAVTRAGDSRQLSGGDAHLIDGWRPLDEHLEAKQYSYEVPSE